MADIDFVGQMGAKRSGTTSGAITFALTNGLAAVPAAGDVVIISVSSGRYPLNSNNYHGSPVGYTAIGSLVSIQSLLADFQWRSYYKVMGGTPDTTFTPTTAVDTSARNAFQVLVLRGVSATIFASTVEQISGTGPASYDPADITTDAGVFDPGDIGGTTGNNHYAFASFALLSTAEDRAMPIVVGGQCVGNGAPETEGNLTAIFQYESDPATGARFTRAHGLYGANIVLPEDPVDPPDPPPVIEDDLHLKAWYFPLDDHEFYVLKLGVVETLVCDLRTGQWYTWGSEESDYWEVYTGKSWLGGQIFAEQYGSNILVGSPTNGALYFLDPASGADDDPVDGEASPRRFLREITGQVTATGVDSVPCYGVILGGDIGDLEDSVFAEVALSTSDDRGVTFEDHEILQVSNEDGDTRLEWGSLGSFSAPGRLFRIRDFGALQRIDYLEMVDPADDDDDDQ